MEEEVRNGKKSQEKLLMPIEALRRYLARAEQSAERDINDARLWFPREQSPLQEQVETEIGGRLARAMVVAGIDPGTFFCGGLLRHLSLLSIGRQDIISGLIHVPPHLESCCDGALLTRAELLDLTSLVLGRTLAGIVEGTQANHQAFKILVTGYGPFFPARENPTELFCRNSAALVTTLQRAFGDDVSIMRRTAPIEEVRCHVVVLENGGEVELFTDVFPLGKTDLDAIEGRYYEDMSSVRERLSFLEMSCGEMNAMVGLGVDSQQGRIGGDPTFLIETQAQGFELKGRRDEEFSLTPSQNLSLAEIWMRG